MISLTPPKVGYMVLPQFNTRSHQWERRMVRGRVFDVEGRLIELFPARVLARAMGKHYRTLWRWEHDKLLPKPMWVVDEPREDRQSTRWYSKQQIANLRALWKKHYGRKGRTPQKQRIDKAFWAEVRKVFYQLDYTPLAQSQSDVM